VITVGSLFAGIGGIELGLECTGGFRTVWQVEIDDYARQVLAKHWPDVRRCGDVRTFPTEPVDEWGCDLICGGFPCQDISSAGKRAGIDGERSGLWSEYVRIIRTIRPRFVLVENVSALLARGMDRVLGDLAEGGYDAEWHCLPAAAFGAYSIRDRVFILAYPNGYRCTQICASHQLARQVAEKAISPWRGLQPQLERGASGRVWAVPHALFQRMADGFSRGMVLPLRAYGNAVVPQIAEWIGHQILAAEATT